MTKKVLINIKKEEQKLNKIENEKLIKEKSEVVNDDTTNKDESKKEDVINKEKSEEKKNNKKSKNKSSSSKKEKELLNKLNKEIQQNIQDFIAISIYPEDKKIFIKRARQATKIALNKNANLYNIVKKYDKEFYKNIKENTLSVYNYIYANNKLLMSILKELNVDIDKENISYEECKKYFNLEKNIVFISKKEKSNNKEESNTIVDDTNKEEVTNKEESNTIVDDTNKEEVTNKEESNTIVDSKENNNDNKINPFVIDDQFNEFIKNKFNLNDELMNKFITKYNYMIPLLKENNLDLLNNNYQEYSILQMVLTQYDSNNITPIKKYLENCKNETEKNKFIMTFLNNYEFGKILLSYNKLLEIKEVLQSFNLYDNIYKDFGIYFINLLYTKYSCKKNNICMQDCLDIIDNAKKINEEKKSA